MPNKWSNDEEINMINMLKNKNSIKEISRTLNRSENAIEQRINKIIYDNIKINGKSSKDIARTLNMSVEDVKSHYNDREHFLLQKIKSFTKDVKGNVKKDDNIKKKVSEHKSERVSEHKSERVSEHKKQQKNMSGGERKNKLLINLETENKFMEEYIKNKTLHNQINSLIKSGKIDANVNLLIKKFRT